MNSHTFAEKLLDKFRLDIENKRNRIRPSVVPNKFIGIAFAVYSVGT